MSETYFPINDLLRRKLQTALVVISLTLCVASTLFLLLFGDKMGFGISLMIEDKLTASFSTMFSRFVIFIGILIFIVGAVIVSFMVFVMMSQRIRDIGLMKAVGCPNDLIFGYFMNELVMVTFAGCFFGVVLGIVADFVSANFFNNFGFQFAQKSMNIWIIILVFVVFLVLALVFGAKPILNAVKVEPAKAISPAYSEGITREEKFKPVSKSGFAVRIAFRSLLRRKSASLRIVLCLTVVFILVTVAIAGGVIADQTTKNWVETAMGRDVIVIGHRDICSQYASLLSSFYGLKQGSQLNFTDERYFIPDGLLNKLGNYSAAGTLRVDTRLVVEMHVAEVKGYNIDPDTKVITHIGDNRQGESLVIGVEPEKVLNDWFLDGEFLKENHVEEAVVGDSLAQKLFTMPLKQSIRLSDNGTFRVVGVCLDPINNGNVTYVPLKVLQDTTGIYAANIVVTKIDPNANRANVLSHLREYVKSVNSEFEIFEINETIDKNLGFLSYIWSSIMLLPLFSLLAASLCLIGYVGLVLNEQRQEFGVLRAIGIRPGTVVKIVSWQSFLVVLASYGVGVSLGIMFTLLVLVPKPVVTDYTVLEIACWLLIALAVTFVSSLYPAVKFAKKPILEMMAQT